jgi:hypothetical protein
MLALITAGEEEHPHTPAVSPHTYTDEQSCLASSISHKPTHLHTYTYTHTPPTEDIYTYLVTIGFDLKLFKLVSRIKFVNEKLLIST